MKGKAPETFLQDRPLDALVITMYIVSVIPWAHILSESSEFLCQFVKRILIFRDYCKRAIRATQKTILGSFGIDEADAKVRALAIGKEVMYAEEPEKEEDEYGTFWFE